MNGAASETMHAMKITPDTDPDDITKVGGALLYILKSHNMPVSPTEIFKNSERIYGESFLDKVKYEVFPGSIRLFHPSEKGYFDELRNYRSRMSRVILEDVKSHLGDFCDNIRNGKETRLVALGIRDARSCSNEPCSGSAYIFEYPVEAGVFEISVRDKTCAAKPFAVCKKVIGSVIGKQVVDINQEE